MLTARPVLATAIVTFLLGGILSVAAYGDAPKPSDAAAKIGIVDVSRVEDEYTEVKDATTVVNALEASLTDILKMRQKYSLLSPQELDELEKLTGLEKPEDKDKQRITELSKKGDDLAAELETLRNKKDPTDADKARLTELTAASTKSSTDVEARRAEYATKVQGKQKELLDKLTDKMNAAIAELAQQKSFWVVVAKPVTLWGGTDITDELIAKLNKDVKPK
jgi:Skp family chaperone for outer membrane proteins